MNFFAHQDQARRQSRRLLVLFALAVATITGSVAAVVAIVADLASSDEIVRAGTAFSRHSTAMTWAAVVTLGVIAIASLFKIGRLRAGGSVVARELGATELPAEGLDPQQRRLRNVVEEIAIASGVPVPQIFVMEQEAGINAFAAGFGPSDAAVAVTRGAMERLSREELQGVIAHEFSHVLNGDMRLNIRLMGVLFGILVIGIAAREFLVHTRGGGDRRDGGAIVLAALAIMVIGYVGLFFGRLIKAGISRQREFLADASAVQFTRQSSGIAGALKKIGAISQGSKLETANAEEVSHMLFGDGVGYSRLFATHPPLFDRIRRIEPRFDEREIATLAQQFATEAHGLVEAVVGDVEADVEERIAGLGGTPLPAARAELSAPPADVVRHVGAPAQKDYATAGELRSTIPDTLRVAAHLPDRAPSVVMALALDADAGVRGRQLEELGGRFGPLVTQSVEELGHEVRQLHPMQRLPLAALAFPALRRRPRPELLALVGALDRLIRADGAVHIGEYCLAKLVSVQVMEALDPSSAKPLGRKRLSECRGAATTLLAILARAGHDDEASARRAYAAGLRHALPDAAVPYTVPADPAQSLDRVLPELDALDAFGKQLLVEALTHAIGHDGRVAVVEAELLRTVCASLHCPLPPLAEAA